MTRKPEHIEVPLSGKAAGRVMLVDAIWHDYFSTRSVCLASHGYAVTRGPQGGRVLVHRLVTGCTKGDGVIVDHLNHDVLDNRSSNLRAATRAINNQNKKHDPPDRGVWWRANRWEARVQIDGTSHYLGRFTDKEEAIRVATDFRIRNMPGYIRHNKSEDQES